MLRSHNKWFIPVALSLVGFAPSTATAFPQAPYTFSANYDTLNTSSGISSSISEAFITGESKDAPYSLNKISGLTYTQADRVWSKPVGKWERSTGKEIWQRCFQPVDGLILL